VPPIRHYALVANTGSQSSKDPRVRHEAAPGQLMPRAAAVAIDPGKDGIFLIRIADDGMVAGDTWHMSIEDAQHQAEFEFDIKASDWKPVPEDVSDIETFLLSVLEGRDNQA
jgi:hypothetical protein